MAAGQQKRRLNVVNLASRNVLEQHREKRKKDMDLPPLPLRLNTSISLEWNDKQKRAVATEDQVAISSRDLFPFVDEIHHCHSRTSVADVLTVPKEIFELENLQGVLSYEGWKICLSESERELLSQFLPKGMDTDQVIRELLNGGNFHFGNPFLDWGSLLCSSNAHPDAVIKYERRFNANKRDYYAELQNYHNNLLGDLQRLKEMLVNCEEPGNFEKALRYQKKNRDGSFPSHAYDSRLELDVASDYILHLQNRYQKKNRDGSFPSHAHDSRLELEDKVASFVDPYSSSGDENFNFSDKSHEDSQERLINQQGVRSISASKNKKGKNLSEEDQQVKTSPQSSDPEALSKTRIGKHMLQAKQTGRLIKFKSPNRILGDTKKLEEEQGKKLHYHWSKIVSTEIVSAYASHVERRMQINQLVTSLGQEIVDKFRLMIYRVEEEDECEDSEADQQNVSDDLESDIAVQNCEQAETETVSDGLQALEQIPSLNNDHEPDTDITSQNLGDNDNSSDMELENSESILHSTPLSLALTPSQNRHKNEFICEEPMECRMNVSNMLIGNSETNVSGPSVVSMATEKNFHEHHIGPGFSTFLENTKSNENVVHKRVAPEDVWPAMSKAGMPCYEEAQDCVRSNELSVRQYPPVQGQHNLMNGNMLRVGDEEAILCEPADVSSSMQADNGLSLFHPYAEGRHSGSIDSSCLMQHSYQSLGSLDRMEPQEPKFLMSNSNPPEYFGYSQHLEQRQQQQMLEQRAAQEKELYALHLMEKNMYEYTTNRPNNEVCPVSTGSVVWETNSNRVQPIQSSTNGQMLDHRWSSCDSRAHPRWSSLEIPPSTAQCPGNGNAGGDNLFGFTPQWNGLSQPPFDSVISEGYIARNAYASGTASEGNGIHESHGAQFGFNHQFNYVPPPPMGNNQHKSNNSMAWMNMPLGAGMSSGLMHQGSVIHDSTRRPFLSSWNQ